MSDWQRWRDQTVATIAGAVQARRKALKLTAAELAKRTADCKPMSGDVISDLENGRKKTLDVVELLTLSEALACSPLSLLFPDALSDTELFPGGAVPVTHALGWIQGEGVSFPRPGKWVGVALMGDPRAAAALEMADSERAMMDAKRQLSEAEWAQSARAEPDLVLDQHVEHLRRTVTALTSMWHGSRLKYLGATDPGLFETVACRVFDDPEWVWGAPDLRQWRPAHLAKGNSILARLLAERGADDSTSANSDEDSETGPDGDA